MLQSLCFKLWPSSGGFERDRTSPAHWLAKRFRTSRQFRINSQHKQAARGWRSVVQGSAFRMQIEQLARRRGGGLVIQNADGERDCRLWHGMRGTARKGHPAESPAVQAEAISSQLAASSSSAASHPNPIPRAVAISTESWCPSRLLGAGSSGEVPSSGRAAWKR